MRTTSRLPRLAAALAFSAIALTACGGAEADDTAAGGDLAAGGSAGTCLVGAEDCADDPSNGQGQSGDAPADGALPDDTYVAVAKGMLGMTFEDFESTSWDVPVRVGRKGAETFMLTEDYVLGRQTVEFDEDADGTLVVTKVTVELDGGPVEVDSLED